MNRCDRELKLDMYRSYSQVVFLQIPLEHLHENIRTGCGKTLISPHIRFISPRRLPFHIRNRIRRVGNVLARGDGEALPAGPHLPSRLRLPEALFRQEFLSGRQILARLFRWNQQISPGRLLALAFEIILEKRELYPFEEVGILPPAAMSPRAEDAVHVGFGILLPECRQGMLGAPGVFGVVQSANHQHRRTHAFQMPQRVALLPEGVVIRMGDDIGEAFEWGDGCASGTGRFGATVGASDERSQQVCNRPTAEPGVEVGVFRNL